MSSWINRTTLTGTSVNRNGTTSHTCTFTAASAGNFLVAIVGGAVTFTTPAGWTLLINAVNSAGLYVFTKTASGGESSFSTTHNGSDYAIEGVVYEFYTGSASVGTPGSTIAVLTNTTSTGPSTTSLTGTYTRFAARTQVGVGTSNSGVATSWTLPNTNDYDAFTPHTTTDGIYLTIASDDAASGSSFLPSANTTSQLATDMEGISFALSVTNPSVTPLPWFALLNSADPALFSNLVGQYEFNNNVADTSGQANNGTIVGGVTPTTDRRGSSNSAYTFDGSTGYITTVNSFSQPQVYSVNVWFKTSSTTGGELVGFANLQGPTPSHYDRHLAMDAAGHIIFGAFNNSTTVVITSASTYNDNAWHMATMTMSGTAGMTLYIDGVSVGTNANTASEFYSGWWIIGYNNFAAWPFTAANYFAGILDDIKIYSVALNATQVSELYAL